MTAKVQLRLEHPECFAEQASCSQCPLRVNSTASLNSGAKQWLGALGLFMLALICPSMARHMLLRHRSSASLVCRRSFSKWLGYYQPSRQR